MSSQTFASVNPRYFLNRLALEHSIDSLSLDPVDIIQQLFSRRSYAQMTEVFEDFCEAAVAPVFCWRKSPGDLVAYTEELEQLIEACYLLYRDRQPADTTRLKFLRQFFHFFPLQQWKRILHEWRQAALSTCSIAELGEPYEMIPFVNGMEELLKNVQQLVEGNNHSIKDS